MELLSVYLPKSSSTGTTSGYMEGGGLYALGLIHAGHGKAIIDYLMGQLKDAVNEPVRHGGCLGLGLAALGSGRHDVYDLLKQNLFLDDANVGEAAGNHRGFFYKKMKYTTLIFSRRFRRKSRLLQWLVFFVSSTRNVHFLCINPINAHLPTFTICT